jgi:hypothetical protein
VLASVQGAGAQVPAYTVRSLQCARFLENAHSELHAESGGRIREVETDRAGLWSFRASPSGARSGFQLVGWLDSLSIRQNSGDTTLVPDTDGLIGGRYRGRLLPSGRYQPEVRPFVPDEIAEITDAAAALDDLLPPLPPRALRPGEEWRDAGGTSITRFPDSAGTGLQRYGLQVRREQRETVPQGDTMPIALRQTTVEQGKFVWDPRDGLVSRSRKIVVETLIPAAGRVRRPVRSRLTQTIRLIRLPRADDSACAGPARSS